MQEIWKDVPSYEGLYQVSNLGNVKSLKRKGRGEDKLLKTTINRYYYTVKLYSRSKTKTFKVHQLVAMAFLNHEPCGYEVVIDHIDNNPLNNNVNNLQLITQRENASKDRKCGTSKHIGVSWHKQNKKWHSRITINNKCVNLGFFSSELEASEVYQNALKSITNK